MISTYGERAMFRAVSIGAVVYDVRGGKVKNLVERKF